MIIVLIINESNEFIKIVIYKKRRILHIEIEIEINIKLNYIFYFFLILESLFISLLFLIYYLY
jgi:hypothetical protein